MKFVCTNLDGREEKCESLMKLGLRISFSCREGYWPDSVLETNRVETTICDLDNQWSSPIYKCVKGKWKDG